MPAILPTLPTLTAQVKWRGCRIRKLPSLLIQLQHQASKVACRGNNTESHSELMSRNTPCHILADWHLVLVYEQFGEDNISYHTHSIKCQGLSRRT